LVKFHSKTILRDYIPVRQRNYSGSLQKSRDEKLINDYKELANYKNFQWSCDYLNEDEEETSITIGGMNNLFAGSSPPIQFVVWPLELSDTNNEFVKALRLIYNRAVRVGRISTGDLDFEQIVLESDKTHDKRKGFSGTWTPEDYSPKEEVHEGDVYKAIDNLFFDPKYDSFKKAETFDAETRPHSVDVSRSTNKEKKLMAVFEDKEGKKIKTTHFGQRGASDYTKHGENERMKRYLERHGGGTTTSTKEDWNDPKTAGSLSRWVLWNKPNLKSSFNDYKSRFGLKGTLNVSKSAEEKRQLISELVCFKCGVKDEIANYNWNENAKGCCGMGVREKRYYANKSAESFEAESGQMCDVCFGNDDLPYDSDHFTKCGRCKKSVCMDCDGEMEYHPDWFKVCGECDTILENVSIHGADSFGVENETIVDEQETDGITTRTKQYKDKSYDIPEMRKSIPLNKRNQVDDDDGMHQLIGALKTVGVILGIVGLASGYNKYKNRN